MRGRQENRRGANVLVVRRDDAKLLQEFLSARLGISRRAAKAAIDERRVWVDGNCVWMARHALRTGSEVRVQGETAPAAAKAASRTPVPALKPKSHCRILWSDEDYLVCDKPAGMLAAGDGRSVEALLREQENIPGLAAVHRLDRDTTGCMLFAKNKRALDAAVETFKTHSVSKTYHAIVAGKFPYAHMTIDAPIEGRRATSRVARETATPDASFLRVRIETGRTNQIRRHLASVRHPVLGDRVFGLKRTQDARLMAVPRQMLHASTLALAHPLAGRAEIKVHSPLPADFRKTLKIFGL